VKAVQNRTRNTTEERICETDDFLSLEWKYEGVTDGENESGDCDEVMHTG